MCTSIYNNYVEKQINNKANGDTVLTVGKWIWVKSMNYSLYYSYSWSFFEFKIISN